MKRLLLISIVLALVGGVVASTTGDTDVDDTEIVLSHMPLAFYAGLQ